MIKPLLFILAATCLMGSARADVQFSCPSQLAMLGQEVPRYLLTLGIPAKQFTQAADSGSGTLLLALATPADDTRTLDFSSREGFSPATERICLPTAKGTTRAVQTVSKKEIALALLQHGRVTEFSGETCSLEALADHVGVRQNIVAWSENLHWVWPNGGKARWNSRYWKWGTPNPGVSLHVALMDLFLHQNQYAIGCYTATKLIMVHAVIDYYHRVKKDPQRARRIEEIVLADGEPLEGIEPGKMWSFEADFDPRNLGQPG